MRIGTLAHTLAKAYLNPASRRRTIFLKGPSGIGKTEGVFQMANILKAHIPNWDGVRDIRLSQFAPEDFRGVPYVAEGRTFWAVPSFWPKPGTADRSSPPEGWRAPRPRPGR